MRSTFFVLSLFLFTCVACSKSSIEANTIVDKSNGDLLEGGVSAWAYLHAIVEDDIGEIERFIQDGQNLNQGIGREPQIITPLLAAIAYERKDIIQLLIGSGALTTKSYSGIKYLDLLQDGSFEEIKKEVRSQVEVLVIR